MKKLLFACAILLLIFDVSAKEDPGPEQLEEWMTYYYRHPHPEQVAAALKELSAKGYFENDDVQAPFSGFFSAVFAANPDKLEAWISPYVGVPARHILYSALWMADSKQSKLALERLAKGAAAKEAASIRSLLTSPPPTLRSMTLDSPATLDYLWGRFMATGSDEPVLRIIDQMKRRDIKGDVGTKMIGEAATWSVSANARTHERVLRIITARADSADPATKTVLKEILDAIEKDRTKK